MGIATRADVSVVADWGKLGGDSRQGITIKGITINMTDQPPAESGQSPSYRSPPSFIYLPFSEY